MEKDDRCSFGEGVSLGWSTPTFVYVVSFGTTLALKDSRQRRLERGPGETQTKVREGWSLRVKVW